MPDLTSGQAVPASTLEQWAAEGSIEWLGHRDDIPEIWRRSHIAVLPSYYREGIPRSLLEAAAALLHKLEEGRVRSRPAVAWDGWGEVRTDWLVAGDDNLQDPGDGLAADVTLDTLRNEIRIADRVWQPVPPADGDRAEWLLGALFAALLDAGLIEQKSRRVVSARRALLDDMGVERRDALASAFESGIGELGESGVLVGFLEPFATDDPTGPMDALPMLYYRVAFPDCAVERRTVYLTDEFVKPGEDYYVYINGVLASVDVLLSLAVGEGLRRAGLPEEALPVLRNALSQAADPPPTELLAELSLAYYAILTTLAWTNVVLGVALGALVIVASWYVLPAAAEAG